MQPTQTDVRATRPGGLFAASLHLGRVAGIPLRLHYSWFVIATLITLSLAGQFRADYPAWGPTLTWVAAAVTAVLFFVSLLAHELSHAVVAMARDLPVRSITLFALGGVAQIDRDANSARTEFLVAIAGPIASVAIGVACLAIARSLEGASGIGVVSVLGGILGWLGSINIVLAVFNLIPGYPLDGGRVLRAMLWARSGDMERATLSAARTGQVVAGLFIMIGLVQAFSGEGIGGLWLAFIGWFLLVAAQANYAHATIAGALRHVRVGDIMTTDCARVDADDTLDGLVEGLFFRTGQRCVMVMRDGRVMGLVTPNEVRQVDRERWPVVRVGEAMRPLDALRTVAPGTPAAEAFATMARDDVNQLPVVADGRLEGVVTRAQILQLLQSRSELHA
jgi:Zn-dependent protease/predicted transcriptional regulator